MSDERFPEGEDYEARVNRIGKTVEKRRAEILATTGREGGLYARFVATIVSFFEAQWEAVWIKAQGVFAGVLGPLAKIFSGDAWALSKSNLVDMFDVFITTGMLDKDDVDALHGFMDRLNVAGRIVGPLIKLQMFFKVFTAFSDVIGGTAIQKLNHKYSPTVPDPGSVIRTSFIAPELHDQVVDLCKRAGYSEDDIKLLFVSQLALQNPVDIMQLVWRGELTKDQAINRMQELGFTADRIAELMKLWERIPTLQDVVRYMGKEAFEPAMIDTFGLMDGFPQEAVDWAAKQGLGKRWAEAEWVSHWRDIGITFMLSAFHRGIVDWPFVDKYMNLIEFPPGVREVVRDTAYTLITRVDIRRMHKIGKIGPEKVEELYRHRGFSPDDARLMTEWTIEYNGGDDRELTKSDILKGYEDGDLTQQDAFDMLTSLGYDDNMAGYYVFRVDQEKDRSLRMDYLEDIKFRYINNVISRADAEREMLRIGFDLSRVNALLSKYDNLRKENDKLPSKTDLDKQLRHKIISEADYRLEMSHLGYKDLYISRYVEMIGKVE